MGSRKSCIYCVQHATDLFVLDMEVGSPPVTSSRIPYYSSTCFRSQTGTYNSQPGEHSSDRCVLPQDSILECVAAVIAGQVGKH